MHPTLRTAVLTHEYLHVVNNDPGGHNPRNEARANLMAALTLIDPNRWSDLTSIHSDYDHICLELGITRAQFMAYYQFTTRKVA
ncbi:hypothetical protein EDF60_1579 [Leucobacter luti]|nr:hypothetical protein [Leucobacter luti]TCK41161.1 hypothetical protein EDF60_1579 [Leucobacter luti]